MAAILQSRHSGGSEQWLADTQADRAEDNEPATSRKACMAVVLRMSGLRPTRQRMELLEVLFKGGHRHFSAEDLFNEARTQGLDLSLATVYNALRQFRAAGLVRELPIDSTRSFFDTNTTDHHHFFIEDEGRLIDIPAGAVQIGALPSAPDGMTTTHVDVVVRVRRKKSSGAGSVW